MTKFESKGLSTLHRIPSLWASARDDLAARRAARDARESLIAELADYTTAADRNDLNALLDCYPDPEVEELRELLNRPVAA